MPDEPSGYRCISHSFCSLLEEVDEINISEDGWFQSTAEAKRNIERSCWYQEISSGGAYCAQSSSSVSRVLQVNQPGLACNFNAWFILRPFKLSPSVARSSCLYLTPEGGARISPAFAIAAATTTETTFAVHPRCRETVFPSPKRASVLEAGAVPSQPRFLALHVAPTSDPLSCQADEKVRQVHPQELPSLFHPAFVRHVRA